MLLGAGRVATHIGLELLKQGKEIVGVWNHNVERANKLARLLGTATLSTPEAKADLAIIAVSDEAIHLSSLLIPRDIPTIHTSGATSINVLQQDQSGVLWPLQTFSLNEKVDWKKVPLCIEASSMDMEIAMQGLAQSISEKVDVLDSNQRKDLHLAAVIGCNFSNAMYALADDWCKERNLDFAMLHRLIEKTASKAVSMPPKKAQTGPAARQDLDIVNQQLDQLRDFEDWQELYSSVTQLILKQQHE